MSRRRQERGLRGTSLFDKLSSFHGEQSPVNEHNGSLPKGNEHPVSSRLPPARDKLITC